MTSNEWDGRIPSVGVGNVLGGVWSVSALGEDWPHGYIYKLDKRVDVRKVYV